MVRIFSALLWVFLFARTLRAACGMRVLHDPFTTAGGLLQYIVSFLQFFLWFIGHWALILSEITGICNWTW